jgi:ribonuclease T2
MNKPIFLFILFGVSLFARHEAFLILECPAFNNMKHTQNIHGGLVEKAGF